MKKLLFVALLLIGAGFITSCNKDEGSNNDKGKLEGKWWIPEKYEMYFNGTNVYTSTDCKEAPITNMRKKYIFQDGRVKWEDGFSWDYSFVKGTIYIGMNELKVVKLTDKMLILDERNINKTSIYDEEVDMAKGHITCTFNGMDIYAYSVGEGEVARWYYNKNGEAIECDFHEYNRETSTFDFWFDTQRSYFKAE